VDRFLIRDHPRESAVKAWLLDLPALAVVRAFVAGFAFPIPRDVGDHGDRRALRAHPSPSLGHPRLA